MMPNYYVIEDPQQETAKVLAGPVELDEAKGIATMVSGRTWLMDELWLIHNVQDNDYDLEWLEGAEKPKALEQ